MQSNGSLNCLLHLNENVAMAKFCKSTDYSTIAIITLFKPVPNLMLVNAHAVLDTPESHGNLTCSNPEADKNAFSVYKREKQSGGEHCKARASKYSCYSNQHLKNVMIDDRKLKMKLQKMQ